MTEWREELKELEKKLTVIEDDIRGVEFNLMTNIESERNLIKELIHHHNQELENSNFKRIIIYDILCLMGKYRHNK